MRKINKSDVVNVSKTVASGAGTAVCGVLALGGIAGYLAGHAVVEMCGEAINIGKHIKNHTLPDWIKVYRIKGKWISDIDSVTVTYPTGSAAFYKRGNNEWAWYSKVSGVTHDGICDDDMVMNCVKATDVNDVQITLI